MHRTPQIARRHPAFSLVALVLLTLLPAPTEAGRPENRALLERVNAQWEGATVRMRLGLRVKKRNNPEKWTRIGHYTNVIPSEGSKGYVLFLFADDRSELAPVLVRQGRKEFLPAGTRFVVDAWRLEDPESGENLELHLRLPDGSGHIKFMFQWMRPFSWGWVDLKGMDWVEQYMRLQFFDLQPTEERLVEAPVVSPSEAPPSATAPVSVEMHAVSARPARVARGEEVELVAHYQVEGPGGSSALTEVREIWRGEERLVAFEEEVERPSGVHTSTQPIAVSESLVPGIYTLRIRLLADGEELAAGEALFEVR